MTECPSTYLFDHGDYAEPERCSLPVEHNADDVPWHESGWEADGIEATVRWRWDQDILVVRWPPYDVDPLGYQIARLYADKMVKTILGENYLLTNIPVREIPATGAEVRWRAWGPLPAATALEAESPRSSASS